MPNATHAAPPAPDSGSRERPAWVTPSWDVISLDCEITSYVPDEGGEPPLF